MLDTDQGLLRDRPVHRSREEETRRRGRDEDVNLGVLRWTWRVAFYGYGVLGTDRYPPFTLAETEYPAHLDVAYQERLSRGLVLIKWCLLILPPYLIVAVLTGGAASWTFQVSSDESWQIGLGGGLIGLLALIAGVALLFTGR